MWTWPWEQRQTTNHLTVSIKTMSKTKFQNIVQIFNRTWFEMGGWAHLPSNITCTSDLCTDGTAFCVCMYFESVLFSCLLSCTSRIVIGVCLLPFITYMCGAHIFLQIAKRHTSRHLIWLIQGCSANFVVWRNRHVDSNKKFLQEKLLTEWPTWLVF